MADQIGTTHQGATPSGQGAARVKFDEAAASTKSLSEQAMAAGKDITDKAKDLAENSTDKIKNQASDLVGAAKDVASQATDKLKDAVNDGKTSGADYVGTLANTIRRAAREFDTDLPIAGKYIRSAASQVEGVSDQIRNGNLNDLVRKTQSFARNQPTAFLGLAVLAGFGAVRFLKSASEEKGSTSGASNMTGKSAVAEDLGYRNEFSK